MGGIFGFQGGDEFERSLDAALDFTRRSEEEFYGVVDAEGFGDEDADRIYACLREGLRPIPFGDYLKRYIFLRSRMAGDYAEVELKEYRHIIVESFRETGTPKSFGETSAKIGALARNWLTQGSVGRQTVFLLGFGLAMSPGDVSAFLVKILRERDFDFKDPYETLYWYCYGNGVRYPGMARLARMYVGLPYFGGPACAYGEMTVGARDSARSIKDEASLMRYLAGLKAAGPRRPRGASAAAAFAGLYAECREIVARYMDDDESERVEREAEELSASAGFDASGEDGAGRLASILASRRHYAAEDVTEGDVEKVLCCGTPTDPSGNLLRMSASTLAGHFGGRRMSRQRIREVLIGESGADRYDLITLTFFIVSQGSGHMSNMGRYAEFVGRANGVLEGCSMGRLYLANPYECFLLMCALSDGPMATYADVWERSFSEEDRR